MSLLGIPLNPNGNSSRNNIAMIIIAIIIESALRVLLTTKHQAHVLGIAAHLQNRGQRKRARPFRARAQRFVWVAIKDLKLSYHDVGMQ